MATTSFWSRRLSWRVSNPEVILVNSTTGALAVRSVTTTIPIVSTGFGDLVTTGVAASHARPGGNVTGLSTPSLAR